MQKGICPKCSKLIHVDESQPMNECSECHQQIATIDSIKSYNRNVNFLKRKAEMTFLGSTEYKKSYEYYSKLLELVDNALTVLTATSLSKLYCSNLHNIHIKEATDILLKGSDKVEINNDNAKLLSEFLKKFKEDCLLIISSLSKYKSESKYSYNIYVKAVNEYLYYLNAYLEIYNAMDKLNSSFVENKDAINKEIESAKKLLKEKIKVNNDTETKQVYKNDKGKEIIDIFPNKKKIHNIRMSLYGCMGIGFITAIVGLILISTSSNKLAPSLVASGGLGLFIASYFIGNYLRRKHYGTSY